jgi:hypothetical protein
MERKFARSDLELEALTIGRDHVVWAGRQDARSHGLRQETSRQRILEAA